jgi:ribosome recycling factor
MINLTEYESKMNKSLEVLKREFNGLRTGRASVSLLDSIYIDAYGSSVPLNQVSNISVPESRLITVQVWDENLLTAVESTIRNSDLGLNPMLEGNLIRIPIPELSEERRKELAKIASKYSEDCKVSVRNVRREAMEKIKVLEKDKEISKDESFKLSDQVQEITDTLIEKIDMLFNEKEKDILRV